MLPVFNQYFGQVKDGSDKNVNQINKILHEELDPQGRLLITKRFFIHHATRTEELIPRSIPEMTSTPLLE